MTEEIKRILNEFNSHIEYDESMCCLSIKEVKALLDYITNLQQENEFLKLNNPEMNIEHFRIVKENKRKIDNLRKENEKLKENLCKNIVYERWYIHYKSRFEKTIEYINFVINHYKEQLETPIEDTYFDSDVNRKGYILSIIAYLQTILDTLIGSDENV